MKKKKVKNEKKYHCKGCSCSYESEAIAKISSRICKENKLCK